MFVPSIIIRSRNNQHYAQICTTALFCILAPTCFGSSLPSSGSSYVGTEVCITEFTSLCINLSEKFTKNLKQKGSF
jgi:hypothetical protein